MEFDEQRECPSCGTVLEEGEPECPSCGVSFADDDEVLQRCCKMSLHINHDWDNDFDDDSDSGDDDD